MARSPSKYGHLVGGGLRFAGVDQGIDFTGAGPVYALGQGRITRIVRSGSGWPGAGAVVNYVITSGPAKGRHVYIAEDFAPDSRLKVGDRISKGQVLGRATGSGQAPGIEIGWAQPSGLPLAPRPAPRPSSQYTAEGQDFLSFVSGMHGSWKPSPQPTGSPPNTPPGTSGTPAAPTAAQPAVPDYVNQQLDADLTTLQQNQPNLDTGVVEGPVIGQDSGSAGIQSFGASASPYSMWQTIAANGNSSPQTQYLASLASLTNG